MRSILALALLSSTAFAQNPTGLIVPKNWQKTATFKAPLKSTASLPASFDWRTSGLVGIKQQGNCGSCWAFSTTAVIDDLIKLKLGVVTNASEQYLVSCNTSGWGCNGGYFAHSMHVSPGSVPESEYPYTGTDSACASGGLSHAYKLASWAYLPAGSSGVPDTEMIKDAIYSHGPLAVAVYADANFQSYRSGVFNSCASGQINHAVNLVGWDDATGTWIMRNSWGTSWGEQGYMRIKYGCNSIGYAANYAVLKTDAPTPGPTPSPKPTPKPDPTVTPPPQPTPTPPACTPAPVADAGPDVTYNGIGVIKLGTPARQGHFYLWRSSSLKMSSRNPQIIVQPRRTTIYTLQAWTKCGVVRDTVTVTLVKK